jgi:hypothetical protein
LDVCRDLEALEAIDRSLLRGRTVAIHAADATEAEAFKGTMASWGCLLMVLVLFLFVVLSVAQGLGSRWVVGRWWAGGLVLLIGLFLAAQALCVLVREAKPSEK